MVNYAFVLSIRNNSRSFLPQILRYYPLKTLIKAFRQFNQHQCNKAGTRLNTVPKVAINCYKSIYIVNQIYN